MTVKYFRPIPVLGVTALAANAAVASDLSLVRQNYVDQGYGMFLHYNMGTYTGEEWATSGLNVNTFHPTAAVNTDQWATTAVSAGMKYGVLTSKHHDGFALWNTSQSTYDFASTTWYNTVGDANYHRDIVGDYVNSFRTAGLGVGLYYSIWDKQNGVGPESSNTKNPVDATNYVKAELQQLLTNYGHIDALWTDGWGWKVDYATVNYGEVYNYIKTISPDTLLVNNAHEGNLAHTDIVGFETQATGASAPVGNTLPSETCATLRSDDHWFETSATTNYKSAATVGNSIRQDNSRNTAYLLDVPPDKSGAIAPSAVQRLVEIKSFLDAPPPVVRTNLALGRPATESSNYDGLYPASHAVDGNPDTFSHSAASDMAPWWMIDLGASTTIAEVDLINRTQGWKGRLRDITIEILGADGTTVLLTSPLLNPGNTLGGGVNDYANGPTELVWSLDNMVDGRFVRLSRRVETDGSASIDDRGALALAEVGVYVPEPTSLCLLGLGSLALLRRRRTESK